MIEATSVWEALGSAILHFFWQGALIGLTVALLLRSMRRASSEGET